MRIRWAAVGLSLMAASGCMSVKMTGTARTGTEQLLLTGTWDDALHRVDFRPLAGAKVFVDPQYISTVADKDWVTSSIRRTLAEQGALLENSQDKAQVILEPSFGAYGTDMRDTNVGLPGMSLMPSLATGATVASSGNSSSLNLSQTNREDAVIKAILYAYDVKTGRMVWESGLLLNAQGVRDHFFMGVGPFRLSSRGEVERYPDESQARTRRHFFHRMTEPFRESDDQAQ